jgi:hypothetical protein
MMCVLFTTHNLTLHLVKRGPHQRVCNSTLDDPLVCSTSVRMPVHLQGAFLIMASMSLDHCIMMLHAGMRQCCTSG